MDFYQAHTLLSRRLYNRVQNDVEKYRPLDVKLSIRLSKSRAHCLSHSIKTVGENPDCIPNVRANMIIVEVVKAMRQLRCQVLFAGLQLHFQKSESLKNVHEGFLSIDQFAIRMDSFSSERSIPWDAGSVEYAFAWEIIIGEVIGELDPTQVDK
ncbi:unnamed protein product [Thelazia callipaeda]|uniref:ANF_receptor domain-containing protein n=1 Tax=Thelazia callipaeda TaxID=103827 RepID=A0A0N5CTA1_THECL|nr:unnamed protein product [Thelazia callipaeda]